VRSRVLELMIIMGPFQREIFYDSILNRKFYEFAAGKGLLNKERKMVSVSQRF